MFVTNDVLISYELSLIFIIRIAYCMKGKGAVAWFQSMPCQGRPSVSRSPPAGGAKDRSGSSQPTGIVGFTGRGQGSSERGQIVFDAFIIFESNVTYMCPAPSC